MKHATEFNPEKTVIAYRKAIIQRDAQTTAKQRAIFESLARRLCRSWEKWQGEDSLHEMAFGEPVE